MISEVGEEEDDDEQQALAHTFWGVLHQVQECAARLKDRRSVCVGRTWGGWEGSQGQTQEEPNARFNVVLQSMEMHPSAVAQKG